MLYYFIFYAIHLYGFLFQVLCFSGSRGQKAHRASARCAQRVEKPQFKSPRLDQGGGARGGSRPPRVESNAPEAAPGGPDSGHAGAKGGHKGQAERRPPRPPGRGGAATGRAHHPRPGTLFDQRQGNEGGPSKADRPEARPTDAPKPPAGPGGPAGPSLGQAGVCGRARAAAAPTTTQRTKGGHR